MVSQNCPVWSRWVCQLQFLPYYYSDLKPIAGCCRYVPFHQGLQVLIAGHPSDSDVNLETFVLFLSHTSARFYLSVELEFIVCFLHLMHICHARHYSTLRNVHYWKRKEEDAERYNALRLDRLNMSLKMLPFTVALNISVSELATVTHGLILRLEVEVQCTYTPEGSVATLL